MGLYLHCTVLPHLCAVQLIPLGSTIYYSFFEYYRSGLKIIGPTFVGLKNYITLFATDLPKYFGNTLLLWIIGFIPQIAISLLLALGSPTCA